MDEFIKTILSAKRRRFLLSQPIFERSAPVTEAELFHLAVRLNFKFALDLSRWLRQAGFGDIDKALSFREDYFAVLDGEPFAGRVSFAQDASGNRYAFSQKDGGIYCVRANQTTKIADSFSAFMQELIRRDYHLQEWVDSASRA
jgi:hypothetical protein